LSAMRSGALTRLAALGTLSRNAGEGLEGIQSQTCSPSPAPREREGPGPQGWEGEGTNPSPKSRRRPGSRRR
jgi:hypothetical protein